MKIIQGLLLMAILVIFQSCGPQLTFNEPQPENKASLSKFPKGLIGEYTDADGIKLMKITDKLIVENYDYVAKEIINKLDNNYKLNGDTMIDVRSKEKIKIIRKGDSVIFQQHITDTIFSISDKNILKKFKGYYFLNYSKDKAGWEVIKMELKKGELMVSMINEKEEIDKLKEISESGLDTIPYKFKPTKKQFRKFIKEKGFRDTEKYMKVK